MKQPPSGSEQGERSVFAGWVTEQLTYPFGFIFLSFAITVSYHGFQSGFKLVAKALD